MPLRIYGRSTAWSIDGIATRLPGRLDPCASSRRPDHDAHRASARPGGSGSTRRAAAILYDGAEADDASSSAAPRAAAGCRSTRSRRRYDQYRGVLRIITSSVAPTVTVVNELRLEIYLPGVVPAEMPSTWPAEALKAQTIAARSYAARRLRPGVVVLRRHGRHAVAGLPRRPRREGDDQRPRQGDRRASSSRAGRASPTRCSTRPAAAPRRTTRTSTCRRPGRSSRRPSATCADRWIARRMARSFDAGAPYATWRTDDLLAGGPVGHLRHRRPDERRDADRARPARSGRLRTLPERDAHRHGRDEEGVRRHLPIRLQRGQGRAPTRSCAARCSPSRRSPDAAWRPDPSRPAARGPASGPPGRTRR